MTEDEKKNEFLRILSSLLGRILDLSEASIPPSQFRAFRKLVMDVFGEFRRDLNVSNMDQGRSGESKTMARGGGGYE